MEALIDAAVHLGFPRHVAHDLVIETLDGSTAFARQSALHPAELRNMVTSPGGTSAAALHELESGRLRTVVSEAVWAAYRRTVELGDQLEASLQEEGSLVLRVLRGALNALAQRDIELADDVISFDDDVDRLYIQIQAEIESVLARQTPVATDLRLVLALLHVNLHLERMADYSVTIAKLTKLVADVEPDPMLSQSLQEMGERAEEMIRVALDSLANRDLAAAESLVDLDELIDRSNRRFVERVVEIVAEPGLREWVLRMVLVSRTLERIGDHAVDIGEQVAYLLTAEFREFTDASHPENA